MSSSEIKSLFRENDQIFFDFSQAPILVRRKESDKSKISAEGETSRWVKAQQGFMRRTRDKRIFSEEYIKNGKKIYDAFFEQKEPLRGNILDIGGGWGLYRQWWQPNETDVFIVHDPGVERFLRGAHQLHQTYYDRAFKLPMTFVEGFGEELPYQDNLFDTCLIAATLDHCLHPQQVFMESYRCLKPRGSILVIQRCYSPQSKKERAPVLKRLSKHLRHPQNLPTVFYNLLFRQDLHLHHFLVRDITLWLETVGFLEVKTSITPATENVYAFEAKKGS